MGNKQTAVEWLKEEMKVCRTEEDKRIVFSIARMMEKEQIINAYVSGEHQQGFQNEAKQYYEETYGAR